MSDTVPRPAAVTAKLLGQSKSALWKAMQRAGMSGKISLEEAKQLLKPGTGNYKRRSHDRERDERVLALLKAGATTQQVRDAIGCSASAAYHLCTRLRREYGLACNNIAESSDKLAKPRVERRLSAPREMLAQFREVCKHLGKDWVADFVGRDVGKLDEDQVVDVMQLHAALLFVLNDGQQVLLDVRERLAELERTRMDHTAQGTVQP